LRFSFRRWPTKAWDDLLHRAGCLDLDQLENRTAIVEALHSLIASVTLDPLVVTRAAVDAFSERGRRPR
jgi:hypothetical protein